MHSRGTATRVAAKTAKDDSAVSGYPTESDFQMTKQNSRCHNTTPGYFVEVRAITDLVRPVRLGHTHVTKEWRTVDWDTKLTHHDVRATGITVTPYPMFDPIAAQQGVMRYEHAVAMMAGAAASIPEGSLMFEFRLRKVKVETEWEITDIGVGDPVNFLELERAEKITPEETE